MDQPLPHRMYLLCYDAGKGRLDPNSCLVRGQLMRAAAAADLAIGGLLRDRDGKAERTPAAATAPGDAFLAEVLDYVPADGSRRWSNVVDRRWHTAEEAVRARRDRRHHDRPTPGAGPSRRAEGRRPAEPAAARPAANARPST
ncbi:GPP34 family phosphoprotein [Saccharopolyspora sp. 5N102]|uniref:GPP34 family phosphoprotein n=1 Tax=Saccharopolyspora sp. 5N102 TaxID=3375155 RepID=UPI0037AC9DD5